MPADASMKTNPERETWSSGTHFTMACISFAVGLGNIWRFPALVYQFNGGAFLIPYFICSFLVGFPLLYLELSLGQMARIGPALVYGRIRPILQGLGWAMVTLSLLVSIYYNMAVGWTLIYIFKIVTGQSYQFSSCTNQWNTAGCSSTLENDRCTQQFSTLYNTTTTTAAAFYFNGTCYSDSDMEAVAVRNHFFNQTFAVSPAEEFFENHILERSPTIDSLGGGFNPKLLIAYFTAWTITALVLFRGVKLIGKVAFITSTVPYLIIAVLFVRSVTLDGARIGLDFFLFKPDLSTLWNPAAWRAAATQVSYSLSVGFGGSLSLSSYNSPDHNVYKDAAIIVIADGAMSIFGGVSVFSVLGYLSKQLNVPIDAVVQSGTGLAFIAYPEALSRMPLSWLWGLLFFVMICLLGVSSQFGYAECVCAALCDQFSWLRKHRAATVFSVCASLYTCGLILCTRAGIYYFNIFDDYSSSFSLAIVLLIEPVLICWIYDLRSMFGTPSNNWLARVFGPTGYYIFMALRFVCPLQAIMIFVFSLITQINNELTYGKGDRVYVLPRWCIAFGWFLSAVPLVWLPIFGVYRALLFKRNNQSLGRLFKTDPKWPTHDRHLLKGGSGARVGDGGDTSEPKTIRSSGLMV